MLRKIAEIKAKADAVAVERENEVKREASEVGLDVDLDGLAGGAVAVAGGMTDDGVSDHGVTSTQTLEPEEEKLVKGIRRASEVLSSGLLEREVEVKLLLLAALTGEHLLLLGPPGTAKSELARRLSKGCHGT